MKFGYGRSLRGSLEPFRLTARNMARSYGWIGKFHWVEMCLVSSTFSFANISSKVSSMLTAILF
jgi:hypothetical protein